MQQFGALPSETLADLMKSDFIRNASEANLRPGSLDLTLSDEIYRVEGVFLPQKQESIQDMLESIHATPTTFDYPLERDVTYLARLEEELTLPQGVYGYCNPRSSTGRNDILVRVIADGVGRFDLINTPAFTGKLWIVISPKSYPILLKPGETLSQLRLFSGPSDLSELQLEISMTRDKLLWNPNGTQEIRYQDISFTDQDGSLLLSAHIDAGITGWECLGSQKVLDFTKKDHYYPQEFFTPLHKINGYLLLRRNGFYILKTKENVRVPKTLACEMVPMDERTGEFRTHYAGFIDPGWGYGTGGEGCGRSLVMEIRPFEDVIIRDGQPIAKIRFQYMTSPPAKGYDELHGSHYAQSFGAPRLSSHFRLTG